MRKNRATATVEKNDRGVSAAGEVVFFGVLFILLMAGGLMWGAYSLATFLWRESVAVFGHSFVVIALWAIPLPFVIAAAYGFAGRVAIWLDVRSAESKQAHLQATYVQPNDAGLLPVNQQFIDTADGSAMAMQLAIAAQRAQWTVSDVPHHLTYAPKYNNRQDVQQLPGSEQAALPAPQPQSFWQLYSAHQLPEHGFLMGYSLTDGGAINADWSKLYSALIGGKSGSGKSTLIRSILAQSALQGGRFLVLDPHFGSGDESLGASLQPLRHLMLTDVAGNDAQMRDAIGYVRDIGQRRLTGRDSDRTPIILVVDETTALLQRSSASGALVDALGEISQETRKIGVYAMCIGQNFHSNVFPTTVRDCFVSMLSCRTGKRLARVQADDNEFGQTAAKLQRGQAVWMTPQGEMFTFAVPNCTANDLEMVAQHTSQGEQWRVARNGSATLGTSGSKQVPNRFQTGSGSGSVEPQWNHDGTKMEPPLEPGKMARIATMRGDGIGVSEIIRSVFGVQGKGRAWQDARASLQQAIDYIDGGNP